MSDKNQDLAKEFMLLWQKQLSTAMNQGDVAGQLRELMNMMQEGSEQKSGNNEKSESGSLFTNSSDELHQLQQRLASCEARIAELESRVNKAG